MNDHTQHSDDISENDMQRHVDLWRKRLEQIDEALSASEGGFKGSWQSEAAALQDSNAHFQQRLPAFNLQLEGLKECEDIQCEAFYINDYTQLRNDIETHLQLFDRFRQNFMD